MTLAKNVRMLLKLQNNVRLFHWTSKVYANHVVSDSLYEDLDKHIDRFIEVYIARYGKPDIGLNVSLNLMAVSDEHIVTYLKSAMAYLGGPKFFDAFKNDVDLQSILSDIVESINRAIYLMGN